MRKYFCKQCGRLYDGTHHSKDYCRKHELQLKKYGRFLDANPRNNFDPNEFRFIGNDKVEFDTYDQYTGNVVATFTIDAEDFPKVHKYKWHEDKHGYARNQQSVLLHRLILDAKPGAQVDHIDNNTHNNCKANLRSANNSLNQMNRKGYNKLGIKGIEYHEHIQSYSAYFRKDGKQYHSRCYKTAAEAAFARYILEQLFSDEYLQQYNSKLFAELTLAQKETIITDTKIKFNINV